MTIAPITFLSVDEARARLAELHGMIGDLGEFRARGIEYSLEPDDAAIYDELRDLEYLLDQR